VNQNLRTAVGIDERKRTACDHALVDKPPESAVINVAASKSWENTCVAPGASGYPAIGGGQKMHSVDQRDVVASKKLSQDHHPADVKTSPSTRHLERIAQAPKVLGVRI
jgi:hypothetical protein